MGENIGRNFSPLNVSVCFSTTRGAMSKWIAQSDSTHQIGPETTPKGFLIVVGTWSTGGWKSLLWMNKISFPSFQCFGWSVTAKGAMDKLRPQADSAHQIGLETSLVAFLILGWWCFIDGQKYWPEFFILKCWYFLVNNQRSYGQMDGTSAFSASKRSRNHLGRSSDCSWKWW